MFETIRALLRPIKKTAHSIDNLSMSMLVKSEMTVIDAGTDLVNKINELNPEKYAQMTAALELINQKHGIGEANRKKGTGVFNIYEKTEVVETVDNKEVKTTAYLNRTHQ